MYVCMYVDVRLLRTQVQVQVHRVLHTRTHIHTSYTSNTRVYFYVANERTNVPTSQRVSERASVRACVRACVRVCVCAFMPRRPPRRKINKRGAAAGGDGEPGRHRPLLRVLVLANTLDTRLRSPT